MVTSSGVKSPLLQSGRAVELDMYRALGALLVIVIHITATPVVSLEPGLTLNVMLFLNRIAKPAVPMFMLASGAALYMSYREKPFRYGEFLKRRVLKVLVPYVVWCAVYFIYNESEYDQYYIVLNDGISYAQYSASVFLRMVLEGKAYYHLYFMVPLIQFYLLFGILRAVVKRFSGAVVLPLSLVLFLVSLSPQVVAPEWQTRCFLNYFFYFMTGCYMAKNYELAKQLIKRWWWAILIPFAMGWVYYYRMSYAGMFHPEIYHSRVDIYSYSIFCSAGVILYFGLAWLAVWMLRESGGKKGILAGVKSFILWFFMLVNENSYYIYLAHPAAIVWAQRLCRDYLVDGVLRRMVVELVVIMVTVIPLSALYTKGKKMLKNKMTTGKIN